MMAMGLFHIILHYLLVATIAINGINIVGISTTLATLLGTPGLSLHRQPRPTLGAKCRIRNILEMATGTCEVNVETGTTLFTKFCILIIGRPTASTFHDEHPVIALTLSMKG